jgi:hypothetical protein
MDNYIIPKYYCINCPEKTDHTTKACPANICKKCFEKGHCTKDCGTKAIRGTNHSYEDYIENRDVQCGCNQEEVNQQRQERSKEKKCPPYNTHCCNCRNPHTMRNLTKINWRYICYICIKKEDHRIFCKYCKRIYQEIREDSCEECFFKYESPSTPPMQVIATGPIYNPTTETRPYQPIQTNTQPHINVRVNETAMTIDEILECLSEDDMITDQNIDQGTSQITEMISTIPDHLLNYCECNPEKNPRSECPYHNHERCICYNKKAIYCGKCDHKITMDTWQDCINCYKCEEEGRTCLKDQKKYPQDFVGGCPITCGEYGPHQHYLCKKHKEYFDNDQCNKCATELHERSTTLPQYSEVVQEPVPIGTQEDQQSEVTQPTRDQYYENKITQLQDQLFEQQLSTEFWQNQWQIVTQQKDNTEQLLNYYIYLSFQYYKTEKVITLQRFYRRRKSIIKIEKVIPLVQNIKIVRSHKELKKKLKEIKFT